MRTPAALAALAAAVAQAVLAGTPVSWALAACALPLVVWADRRENRAGVRSNHDGCCSMCPHSLEYGQVEVLEVLEVRRDRQALY